jgi:hypothetical protein
MPSLPMAGCAVYIASGAFDQLFTGFAPADPLPVGHIAQQCRELAAAFERINQLGQACGSVQIEIRHELAADFAEHRNVAAHRRQSALHGFHQRQAEAFDVRREHQRTWRGRKRVRGWCR